MRRSYVLRLAALVLLSASVAGATEGQSVGNATTLNGTVVDATGAIVLGATVKIHNPVSGYDRSTETDTSGQFSFSNVPFNPYHLTVTASGFSNYAQDVELRSNVPVALTITLRAAVEATTVTVRESAGDLVETDSTFHSDVDRNALERLPMPPESSGVAAAVTAETPGVSADSNNMMHGLGDHAENTISVDSQANSDQTSKTFSNQIPSGSIQSMEVIAGAPPAEFGGKTSLIVKVSTRSGQGVTTPTGSLTTSYGSFGTTNASFDLAYGGPKWGNFIAIDGTNGGRFLDAPEFAVMHDKGNVENVFDRVDYQIATGDTLHLNLAWSRSWFQTPQTYDDLNIGHVDPVGNPVPPRDQRSQIKTFNIAPSWTRLISQQAVFTLGAYVRKDNYHYYPSDNPFSDLGPVNLQRSTVGQHRSLMNAGVHTDLAYVRGINNMKFGFTYQQTPLNESVSLGVVDPTLIPTLTTPNGLPCFNPITQTAFAAPCTTLLPYDLTRGGSLYFFKGHTDVKEISGYGQDTITAGAWSFNLGLRIDRYNGLSDAYEVQPRLGVAYSIKKTSTVLRASYARTLESPFNQNLLLSATGCDFPVIAALVPCVTSPVNPRCRNEIHAGLQQTFRRYLVFDGEYIWKYTHNAYDFSVLGNTPITFPIEWHNSKIPGYAASVKVPNLHGLTATAVFSSVSARFFPPQVGGLGVTVGQNGLPFRIDHDEQFNSSAHLQYQPWKDGPWFAFNWRYDSGQVAGSSPCYGLNPGNDCPASTTLNGQPAIEMVANGAPMTADQEFEAGLFCGNARASLTTPLPSVCPASQFGSTLINVPAPGTQNNDKNPARIAPRYLFDVSIGHDNLFHGDRYKVSVQLTAVNLTNEYALYNFLSTFSGTHYVSPRSLSAELGLHF